MLAPAGNGGVADLRGSPRRGVLCAGLLLTLALVALTDRDAVTRAAIRDGRPAARAGRDRTVVATIVPGATGRPIPRSFLGLSTEYWSLPSYEGHLSAFGRVLSMLHAAGDGPLLIRVGGNSADHTFWEPDVRSMPRWMFQLTPSWLRAARLLVADTGVRLILDLNLITDRPAIAMDWARAAETELARGSIVGFEIGNEPDIYSRWFWLTRMARTGSSRRQPAEDSDPGRLQPRLHHVRPPAAPARARHPAARSGDRQPEPAPVVDLGRGWTRARPHRHRQRPPLPVLGLRVARIEQLPDGRARAQREGLGRGRPLATAGRGGRRRAGLPLRLTEINSVTCGGLAGVSNTFATALWAPDALFELMRAGVSGVNVHVRTDAINAAFKLTSDGLAARPLLYGLIAFRRILGTGPGMLVPVRESARPRSTSRSGRFATIGSST